MLNQNVCLHKILFKIKQKEKCHRDKGLNSLSSCHTEPTLIELLSDLGACKQEEIQFETLIVSWSNKKQTQ